MKKSKRQLEIEARKAADPIAQALGRTDIDYSSDDLPTAPRMSSEQLLEQMDRELKPLPEVLAHGIYNPPLRRCLKCQRTIGTKNDECTGWHPEFKCDCGFEASGHARNYRFCPMCGKGDGNLEREVVLAAVNWYDNYDSQRGAIISPPPVERLRRSVKALLDRDSGFEEASNDGIIQGQV